MRTSPRASMSATARSCIRRLPLRSASTEGRGETSAWSRLSRGRRGRKFLPRDASPRVHQPVRFFPRNGPAFSLALYSTPSKRRRKLRQQHLAFVSAAAKRVGQHLLRVGAAATGALIFAGAAGDGVDRLLEVRALLEGVVDLVPIFEEPSTGSDALPAPVG